MNPLDHLKITRSGETKLVLELTFSSEVEASQGFEALTGHFKNGPRPLVLRFDLPPKAVSLERKKT